MNQLQYDRWKQLSLGLTRSYANLTPERRAKLLDAVEDCLEHVVWNGLETVGSWDDSMEHDGIRWCCASTRVDDYLCERNYEFEREYKNGRLELVRGRFGDMLSACVRAGFDMAVSPSAGVIGFTVGDIRDVFEDTIPDWIAEHFEVPAALLAAGRDESLWL